MRFVVRSIAMPVGPSHGSMLHVATTFHVFVSITSMAFLSSMLMKIRPFPLLTPPSGAVPLNGIVATTFPVWPSITTAVPPGWLWLMVRIVFVASST